VGVVPQKSETRAHQDKAELCEEDLLLQQRDHAIGRKSAGGDNPGQTIQTIGKIDCVRTGDDNKCAQRNKNDRA
jgi:hypothetical protein